MRNGDRSYRCTNAIVKYKQRNEQRGEYDPCDGWGIAPKSKKPLTSTKAVPVEAAAILKLVEAFKSPKAMQALREKTDRQNLAIEETKDFLEAAYAEKAALVAERARFVKRIAHLSDGEVDVVFADLNERTLANAERITRLENEAEATQKMQMTVDDLKKVTREKLTEITAFGSEEVEGWIVYLDHMNGEWVRIDDPSQQVEIGAWGAALAYLKADAQAVLDGKKKDLHDDSIEWVDVMANRVDVRGQIVDLGEGDYGVKWSADEVLMFANGQPRLPNRGAPRPKNSEKTDQPRMI